ncbi:hypothetical protein U1Q18_030565 [Sarracenia purpurea var. burkii]
MDSNSKKPVIVRKVWAGNLIEEFSLIKDILVDYPYIAMDTEFPGVIIFPKHHYSHLPPDYNYLLMKANIDALKLIQVGLTFSDATGNLPDFGTDTSFVWEFNFNDFDIDTDAHNVESISLLRKQGIDFERNKKEGIDSWQFVRMLIRSRLICNSLSSVMITWVTFHGAYDFGFMIKILRRRRKLPKDLGEFMAMVNGFFGEAVYDMKHVVRYCHGLYGGLERVAKIMGVDRTAGKSHQAGSDSLLTMQAFLKLNELYFSRECKQQVVQFKSVLYGLELES